jgi:16S rRNA (guanine1207-N2)-methyltransferase
MSDTSSTDTTTFAGRYLVSALRAAGPADLVIALTDQDVLAAEARGISTVPFHEAAETSMLPRARGGAVIGVPERRGYAFLVLVSWLVGRIVEPASEIVWDVGRHPAPKTVHKRLTELGWELEEGRRSGRVAVLIGPQPSSLDLEPRPRSFCTRLGRANLRLEADYGTFSRDNVDEGTRLLIETVLAQLPPHPFLVDVGTGYAPIALALLSNGWAQDAAATDVDSVALWLAARNARANSLGVRFTLGGRPPAIPPGSAVTCNFPTHAERQSSDRLLAELVAAARTATVVIVVHASLEDRFRRRVAAVGGDARRLAVAGHAILQVAA